MGTTGTKTLLFSEKGELAGRAYRAYETRTPRVSYSEQDARDWWRAVTETVRELCADPQIARNVAAISLSLQGGTVVPVDADFSPLRPAIVWNDERCRDQRAAFEREVGSDGRMYEKTGWHLGNGLPALEIRWMRENEPEIFAKTAMFLSVPDYISARMTGVAAVDLSDLGINQLGDIRRACYDRELLDFAGIRENQLPKILRSGEVIGRLSASAAEELGLTENTVLVAGAHDQYAVALGAGANRAGDILSGSGTSWVVTAIGDSPDFQSGLSQSAAAVPGLWGSLKSLSAGGVCLEWWRRNLSAAPDGTLLPFSVIDREASERKAAEDGLFFYPFSGVATPEKSFTKGSFLGLDLSHDRFHLARAIMEGVAFQVVWMTEFFRTKPNESGLKLAGGVTKSALWTQMVADIAGLPVRIPDTADLACVGAAILAGVGCGIYQNAQEGYERLSRKERVVMPDPEGVKRYAPLYSLYKRNAGILSRAYEPEFQ